MISDERLERLADTGLRPSRDDTQSMAKELLALRKEQADKRLLEIENRRLNGFLEMMRSDFKDSKSHLKSENNHEFHMGKATEIFTALRENKISQSVKDAELGPMGAVNVEVWTSLLGGTLRYEQSMGGCSLYISPYRSEQ